MKRTLWFIFFLLNSLFYLYADSENDSLLKVLDKVISERLIYTQKKEATIKELKKKKVGLNSLEDIYNLNKEITVYEDIIKRKVDIFKVFDNGGTGILTTEEGVIFDVYDSSDNKVGSITTDSDGYASIVLPYGAYTFKQVTSTKDL